MEFSEVLEMQGGTRVDDVSTKASLDKLISILEECVLRRRLTFCFTGSDVTMALHVWDGQIISVDHVSGIQIPQGFDAEMGTPFNRSNSAAIRNAGKALAVCIMSGQTELSDSKPVTGALAFANGVPIASILQACQQALDKKSAP
ncbi:MAG: hypothetical protein AAGJ74_12965 [Pseudomonadota bacterium]